jgi:hypothetical protein
MDRDGPSIVGLRNLILYGLKGTAAYSEHARVLGHEEAAIRRIPSHFRFLAPPIPPIWPRWSPKALPSARST